VTSLTRSDVFGGPLQWFMDGLTMLPVYRIRNGYSNLKKNEAIFESCKSLLSNREYIMMFSEASHHSEFFLQTLSKGSSRLAYETQQQSKNPIYIVPIGINYGHRMSPLCYLHLVFGEAIAISRFTEVEDEKPTIINTIRDELGLAMKKCMWLPDRDEHYDAQKKLIHNQNTHRRSFQELKEGIEVQSLEPKKIRNTKKWHTVVIKLFSIPNLPPLLILKRILDFLKTLSSIALLNCVLAYFYFYFGGEVFFYSALSFGAG
jgi:1-acyl-sn-glycerol-3-phosphate acyltransferase